MGEHLMPPALLRLTRPKTERPEKTNMSCKVQLLKDSDSAKNEATVRVGWNKRSALLLLLQYTECVCHAQQNNK